MAAQGFLHSGARIALLFTFAAAMPELGTAALWSVVLLAAIWLALMGNGALRFYLNGLWRLRWLFFAIVVLHLWRGGGSPLWDVMPGLTEQGAAEASRRCAILAALLGAVVILVRSTPPEHLAAGLIWCLWPLQVVGFPVQRLGLRIALVFAAVDSARSAAAEKRAEGSSLEQAAAALLLRAESGHFNARGMAPIPAAGRPDVVSLVITLVAVAIVTTLYLY